MDYFYTPPDLISREDLVVDGDEFSHLTHVMRRNVGDELRVVDGKGTAYDVVITSVEKRAAHCEIRARHSRLNEAETEIAVAVGLLKNASKFDFIVEKATELGVMSITPLFTERTIPQHAKVERWQKLALAAMKQSCRCILPQVNQPMTFDGFVTNRNHPALKMILHERAGTLLRDWLPRKRDEQHISAAVMCIGPEGGFSDREIEHAGAAGFIPLSLGPRRLRTETASIVSIAASLLLLTEVHP